MHCKGPERDILPTFRTRARPRHKSGGAPVCVQLLCCIVREAGAAMRAARTSLLGLALLAVLQRAAGLTLDADNTVTLRTLTQNVRSETAAC